MAAVNLQPASALGTNATIIGNLTTCTVSFDQTHVPPWIPGNARAIKLTCTSTSWATNWDAVAAMQATITAGQVYSSAVYAFCTTASRSMTIDGGFFITSGGTFVNAFTTPPTVALTQNAWTKVATLNQTAGASTTKFSTKMYSQGAWANGNVVWLAAFKFENQSTSSVWTPGPGDPLPYGSAFPGISSAVRAGLF